MFCSKCGKQIDDNNKVCPYCGNKIGIFNINSIANTIKKATDTAVNLVQSAKNAANEATARLSEEYMEKAKETAQDDTISETESSEKPIYSYSAKIDHDNGTLYIYEEYIHFVSSKNKDISLRYNDMAGVNEKWGSLCIYPFNEKSLYIYGLPKDIIKELSSYIHEKITSLKAESSGKHLYSYSATNDSDNGTLYIYEEYVHFVSSKNEDISLRYSDITKAEENGNILKIFRNEDIISIRLPKGTTKELLPYIQEKISTVWKSEKPESCFEKSFGLSDKIFINDEYGTFIIRYANGKQTPTYYLKDIINYDIKEINKEGDTLSGALMGQYIAGRSGAVLGAKLASGRSDIIEVQCHIMIKTETDSSVLLARIASPAFGVSQSSSKYVTIKAEEMKLEEYLKSVINSKNTTDKVILNNTNTVSTSDEIRKFKELLDEGIISEEEFNAKKKQLLGI